MIDGYAEMMDFLAREIRKELEILKSEFVKYLKQFREVINDETKYSSTIRREALTMFEIASAQYVVLFVLNQINELGSEGLKTAKDVVAMMKRTLEHYKGAGNHAHAE